MIEIAPLKGAVQRRTVSTSGLLAASLAWMSFTLWGTSVAALASSIGTRVFPLPWSAMSPVYARC